MSVFKDRVAVVTGASRGIGRAAALELARQGVRLTLIARTTGALEEVDDEVRKIQGRPATLAPMDLTDFDAIDRLGAAIYERHGKLDMLLANAGALGNLTPLGHLEPKVWDRTMAVNATANWRLIRSLDPLLRQSEAGRALFVTSSVGHQARAYWAAYAVSKAALEMLVKTYAEEIRETNVRANLINPGRTRTAMRAQAYPGENPGTLKRPGDVAEAFVSLLSPDCRRHGELITLGQDGKEA